MRPHTLNLLPTNVHTLLGATASLICGIAWYQLPLLPQALAALTLMCALAFYALRHQRIAALLIGTAFIFGALRSHQKYNFHESFFDCVQGPIDVVGSVADKKIAYGTFKRHYATLRLHKIKPTGTNIWQPYNHTIIIYTPKKLKATIADIIQINNVRFTKSKNKEYVRYLHKEGVSASAFVSTNNYTLINTPDRSISRWLFEKRERLLSSLRSKCSFDTFALFSTIFLGSKQIKKSVLNHNKTLFKRWGIIHYLARSGLHLLIVTLLWHLVLRLLMLPYALKELLLVTLVLTYCTYSWPSVSFARALCTLLLYKMCVLAHLPINAVHILTIACCTLLIYNPAQLFALDFQLSFGLTYALAWIAQVRRQKRRGMT